MQWASWLDAHEPEIRRGHPPTQPIDRALAHLLTYLVRSAQLVNGRADAPDLKLSTAEAEAFLKNGGRKSPTDLEKRLSPVVSDAGGRGSPVPLSPSPSRRMSKEGGPSP